MELNFTEENKRRLENLAKQENLSPSAILEMLFERHARAINTAVLESDDYITFIHLFGNYIQEDLGSMVIEDQTDVKMYKVFEALFAHTLENQIMLADLYNIYKRS